MKIKLTILSIALSMAFVPISAQEAPPSKSEVLADQLLTLMQVDKLCDAGSQQGAKSAEPEFFKNLSTKEKQEFKLMEENNRALSKKLNSWGTVKPAYIHAYSETYTEEELQGMIDFYKSPLGQQWAAKQLQIHIALFKKLQPIMVQATSKLNEELKQAQDGEPKTK
jgi:hypothetical protein